MYGIEQVGFAGSVVAYQTVDLRRKLDMGFRNVLEVDQRQFVEVHKVVFTFPKILNFREYSAARGFCFPDADGRILRASLRRRAKIKKMLK